MSPTSTPIQVLTVDSLARLVTSTLRRPRADLALPPSAAAWPRRQPAAARVAHDSCADEFGSASYGGPRRRAAGLVDQLLVVEAAPQRWLVRWCTQRPRPRRARLPCGTSDPAGPGVRNFVGGAMDSNSFPRPTHNVRRPRKHCVSDTPHAPARAPRGTRTRAPARPALPLARARARQRRPAKCTLLQQRSDLASTRWRACIVRATATAAWATPHRVHRCQLSARLPQCGSRWASARSLSSW